MEVQARDVMLAREREVDGLEMEARSQPSGRLGMDANGEGRSEDGGARGSGHAGEWGAERKERGEAVKGPEAGAVGSPVPAGLCPAQRPLPTRPRGAAFEAAAPRSPGLTFLLLLRSLLCR